jgi:hypothetical protein
LVPGKDRIDLEEEFDIERYCPTTSISSASMNSSQSSLDSDCSQKQLQSILMDGMVLREDGDIQQLIGCQNVSAKAADVEPDISSQNREDSSISNTQALKFKPQYPPTKN